MKKTNSGNGARFARNNPGGTGGQSNGIRGGKGTATNGPAMSGPGAGNKANAGMGATSVKSIQNPVMPPKSANQPHEVKLAKSLNGPLGTGLKWRGKGGAGDDSMC